MAVKVTGGNLPGDSNHKAIQVAANIVTQDGTATPKVFPITTTDATTTTLTPPTNAVVLHLKASGADMNVGDNAVLDGTANEGYFLLEDGERQAFPCADGNPIYFKRNAGVDVTAHGYWEFL